MNRSHGKPLARRCAAAALLLVNLLGAAPALAGDYTVVPSEFVYCTTCHGVELKGNRAVDAPRLNGMEAWYVRNQLAAFRNGWRGTHAEDLTGMEMRPQAVVLTAEGVDDAAVFVAALPRRPPEEAPVITGDAEHGRSLYATCAACHGDRGEGNSSLNAPRLAGQSDWYLARQLEEFRSGVRGSANGDLYGAQMRASAALLTNGNDIVDVVAYIRSLP